MLSEIYILSAHLFQILTIFIIHSAIHQRAFAFDRIQCANENRSENGSTVRIDDCNVGVVHCLVQIVMNQEGTTHRELSNGCMHLPDLVSYCPHDFGVCQSFPESEYNMYDSCCCRGDMCNNGTLKYLPPPINEEPIPIPQDKNLRTFGLHSPDQFTESSPNAWFASSSSIYILCSSVVVCIILICVLLGFHAFRARFCRVKSRLPSSIASSNHSYQSNNYSSPLATDGTASYRCCLLFCAYFRINWNHRCTQMIFDNVCESKNTSGNPVPQTTNDVSNDLSGLVYSATPSVDSKERRIMQLIAQLCRKCNTLGHGRSAQVWLGYMHKDAFRLASKAVDYVTDSSRNISPDMTVLNMVKVPSSIETVDGWLSANARANQSPSPVSPLTGHTTARNVLHHLFLRRSVHGNEAQKDEHELIPLRESTSNDQRRIVVHKELISHSESQENQAGDSNSCPHSHYLDFIDEAVTEEEINEHPERFRQVAVKVFQPTDAPMWRAEYSIFRVLQEPLELLPNVRSDSQSLCSPKAHPNLIRMLGAGVVQSCLTEPLSSSLSSKECRLVMEFADGGSLFDFLCNGTSITLTRLLDLSMDIVCGLAFLHSEICEGDSRWWFKPSVAHRDLKPQNILLRADGSACLSDFGQAVVLRSSYTEQSRSSRMTSGVSTLNNSTFEAIPKAGTLRYMAPELLDGAITFNETSLLRTDVYSLALILWELLTALDMRSSSCNLSQLDVFQSSPHSHPSSPNFIKTEPSCTKHRRQHYLPYARELGSRSGKLAALCQLVSIENYRPLCEPIWSTCSIVAKVERTVTECWDPDPQARLTADCVLERLKVLRTKWMRSNHATYEHLSSLIS